MKMERLLHDKTKEFLKDLPPKVIAKIFWVMDILGELGLGVGRPYVAPLRAGIWELRVKYSGVNYRLLFFVDEGTAVFTNGFAKKSAAVPDSEIQIALNRQREYLQKKGDS